MPTTLRHATCSCGQLALTIEGEPVRISMCHCLECQRRTGAVLSNQARFARKQVTIEGGTMKWTRKADSGNTLTFHFCPVCGSTVYWDNTGFPDLVTVAIGAFADPELPAADGRRLGRVPPPVGDAAARHTAQPRREAEVMGTAPQGVAGHSTGLPTHQGRPSLAPVRDQVGRIIHRCQPY